MIAALAVAALLAGEPDSPEARAAAAEQAGRLNEAFQLYLQVLAQPAAPEVDFGLCERIAKLAVRLNPPPEIPEDAERYATRGQVLFREAKRLPEFEAAEGELLKAVRLAPWVPAVWFNLAIVQEKLGAYEDALASMKLYLLSSPEDAAAARAKLYDLELRQEKRRAVESSPGEPRIGVSISDVIEEVRHRAGGALAGALVIGVARAGPAVRAGLHKGDVVQAVDGRPIQGASELLTQLKAGQVGRPVTLSIWREGRTLERTVVPGNAIAMMTDDCERGVASECAVLGLYYQAGRGTTKDETRALALFERACEAGEADGCNSAGVVYGSGKGVPVDEARAVAFYRQACDRDSAWGCTNIGFDHLNGTRGVAVDQPRALALFRRACDLGDACGGLGWMYEKGIGLEKDKAQARTLYQRGCQRGDEFACRQAKRMGK